MSEKIVNEFPIEKFYPIKDKPGLLLRLTIGKSNNGYWVESDLVSVEGQKIIYHLGLKQNLENLFDATQAGLDFYHSHS